MQFIQSAANVQENNKHIATVVDNAHWIIIYIDTVC